MKWFLRNWQWFIPTVIAIILLCILLGWKWALGAIGVIGGGYIGSKASEEHIQRIMEDVLDKKKHREEKAKRIEGEMDR